MTDYAELSQRVLQRLLLNRGTGDAHDHLTLDTWEWPQGVALYAMHKLSAARDDRETRRWLRAWYDRRLAAPLPPHNVNSTAPMLALTFLYEETRDERYGAAISDWAEWVMRSMPRTEEGGLQHITMDSINPQQLWDDTLYMTCLFLWRAGRALGRPEYQAEAEYQFLLHIKYLHDSATGLWYHGFTFEGRHHFGGAFWARGDSWFTAGAVDFLEWLPEGPTRRLILATWREQCEALTELQDAQTGLWHTLLDAPDSYLETSASAAIAYGLLKGARLGWLEEKCRAAGLRALDGVIGQIDADGTVRGVSYGTPMGATKDFYRTVPIRPTAYGQGLTFLMLTEAQSINTCP